MKNLVVERLSEHIEIRAALDRAIEDLLETYERSTGWVVTRVDYHPGTKSVSTEAVPGQSQDDPFFHVPDEALGDAIRFGISTFRCRVPSSRDGDFG
jgi:hypothetical protein